MSGDQGRLTIPNESHLEAFARNTGINPFTGEFELEESY